MLSFAFSLLLCFPLSCLLLDFVCLSFIAFKYSLLNSLFGDTFAPLTVSATLGAFFF